MERLLTLLDRSPGVALLALAVLVVLLGLGLLLQWRRAERFRRRWDTLLEGAGEAPLATMLEEHLRERTAVAGRLDDAERRLDVLDTKMRSAKRYVGLVRYDAFPDIGGHQSFALAVYDEEGNGVVVTSQVGREGCRVYGKPLHQGKPDRHVSAEEEQAIELAGHLRARPRITS